MPAEILYKINPNPVWCSYDFDVTVDDSIEEVEVVEETESFVVVRQWIKQGTGFKDMGAVRRADIGSHYFYTRTEAAEALRARLVIARDAIRQACADVERFMEKLGVP